MLSHQNQCQIDQQNWQSNSQLHCQSQQLLHQTAQEVRSSCLHGENVSNEYQMCKTTNSGKCAVGGNGVSIINTLLREIGLIMSR